MTALPISKMAVSVGSRLANFSRYCLSRGVNFSSIPVPRRCMSLSSSNILDLQERGIFQNVFPPVSTPDLQKRLIGSPQCMYCGFDPTADSLHVGNLLAIIALLHGQRAGHKVIAVIGGATAQIGDPSGKAQERKAMDSSEIEHNISRIEDNIKTIFLNHRTHFLKNHKKEIHPAKILNNYSWYKDLNLVSFLSSIGRFFRMGDLLSRTSVQTRLQSPEGMSLTEFTYQVFQAFDWLHLYKTYNCTVQIGGNDQIGNIVSGYELVNKVTGKTVYGLTVPLVKSTTGDKLGKTAGNAVWLHPEKTSPFELYQYFFNFADADVEYFLKLFTFLPDVEINDVMKEHTRKPELRKAQKKLAEKVTLLVHGSAGVESAVRSTDVLFNKSITALSEMSERELRDLFRNAPTRQMFLDPGLTVMDAVMAAGCFTREVDAERVIKAGGVYINQQRTTSDCAVLIPGQHILSNGITLIRTGKKNYYIVKWLGLEVQ